MIHYDERVPSLVDEAATAAHTDWRIIEKPQRRIIERPLDSNIRDHINIQLTRWNHHEDALKESEIQCRQ